MGILELLKSKRLGKKEIRLASFFEEDIPPSPSRLNWDEIRALRSSLCLKCGYFKSQLITGLMECEKHRLPLECKMNKQNGSRKIKSYPFNTF